MKRISHYALHVVVGYEGGGWAVGGVAGQFLCLNVYRVTRGHNSCQSAAPLGARRSRGNLFSLARLSSHTETVFVLFDCIAPLGSLTLLPPSLLSLLLPRTTLSPSFSLSFLSPRVLIPPWPRLSPSILLPLRPLSHRDKGEVLLCCVFACLVAGFVVSKWGH